MIKPWQGFEIWKEEMMTGHSRLYLSRADIDQMSLDMSTILRLLEQTFRERAAGRVEMPPKLGMHNQPDAFIHAIPVYLPGGWRRP